jgi:hypothetical protein
MDKRYIDTELARLVAVASRDPGDNACQRVRCLPGVAAVARMPGGAICVGIGGEIAILEGDDAVDVAAMMVAAVQGAPFERDRQAA